MLTLRVDKNIKLSKVKLGEAEELYALTDESRDYLREWLPWVDSTQSPDDTRVFIQNALEQDAQKNGFHCCIWYEGRIAGVIGFLEIDWANRKTELGYWLGEPYQGKGIMTMSCRALIDFAFSRLKLNRVEILAAEGNTKSRAIPERLGFTQEGVLREAERLNNRYADSVVYGMLRREWE